MKSILVLLLTLCAMTSCSSTDEPKQQSRLGKPLLGAPAGLCRAKLLDGGTITFCTLNNDQLLTLRSRDTVWFDVTTHTVSDTAINAEKAVLFSTNY